MRFQIVGAALALISPLVSGLGINCRGSSNCRGCAVNLSWLQDQMNGISDDTWFANGQHVTCHSCEGSLQNGQVCVFVQNYPQGLDAGTIKSKLGDLANHGCNSCGSCPILPGNDVSTGMVTVNYVA
ncbi:killer toxin, partial [Xylona heveae TC161]